MAGASIVVYLGHGNGWPSPYTYDPLFTTKDGFGLNATAGAGDYNVKYYGEPSIASLALAPGAVVILNRLCYASGNSEPGNAEPTVSVARQRADNYAAGFLKAGAAAVIADGHGSADTYIRSLFTTHQSSPVHVAAPAKRHRELRVLSVSPDARRDDVPGPRHPDIRVLAIAGDRRGRGHDRRRHPGRPQGDRRRSGDAARSRATRPSGPRARRCSPASRRPVRRRATLPAGTRLRVVEQAVSTAADGTTVPLVAVEGVDDPKITGFVAPADLVPRDATPPAVRSLTVGTAFSPNGDGLLDTAVLRGRFTESVAWKLTVSDAASKVLLTASGTGSTFNVTWNGLVGGKAVPDGRYDVTVTGDDAWHNGAASATKGVTVDTVPSKLAALAPDADTDPVVLAQRRFEPRLRHHDGHQYRARVVHRPRPECGWHAAPEMERSRHRRSDPDRVGRPRRRRPGRSRRDVHPAREPRGSVGQYRPRRRPDGAGDRRAPVGDLVAGGLLSRRISTRWPRRRTSSFSLARPMTVTWTLRDSTGAPVVTRLDAVESPAGTQTWTFDGRAADGTMLPTGHYTSFVSATDGTLTATQSAAFDMDAFVMKPSDATPGRGQRISVTAVSSESLSTVPRVYIYQPGKAAWSVLMTKTATNTYKATFAIKTGGPSGTVQYKILAKDSKGLANRTIQSYRLH